jgi:lipooligosaccharide transport system ATP-binding protein
MSAPPFRSEPDSNRLDDAGPGDEPLIHAKALTKQFGSYVAVDGVDFAVQRGEVFGFLGPNGAGKTTTMRMIACVSPITDGELRILGMDPRHEGPAIRSRLGVVPQEDNLDTELTVWDNLVIYGRYFGLPSSVIRERAAELLAFAHLEDRRDSRVDPLSGGMKRRLTIARALINKPDLVLLDEPTTGLDPQARHLLWERLYRLKREGVTQVLTTHYMDEAEQLCDRLVIMDEGRIVAEGSPRELIERHSTREVLELRFALPHEQDAALPRLQGVGERVEPLAERVLVYADDGDAALAQVTDRGVRPHSALVRRGSLEDVFLRLTGRSLDE